MIHRSKSAGLQDYLNGLKRKYDYSSVFLVSEKDKYLLSL